MKVYEKRKGQAHVELMHPQTIDEISARMYDPSQGLAPNQYRIEKCDDKPDTTHMLVKYTLDNNDGNYNQTGVLCYGDYFDCNEALKAAIASSTQPMPTQDKSTFEIYQLKGGDDTRDMRFISLDRLAEQGKKPDILTYDMVYEGDYSPFEKSGDTIGRQLEAVYTKFNVDHPADFKGHSLSVSDVVVAKGKAYYVDTFGFKELKAFKAPDREHKQEQEEQKKPAAKKPKR
jgi:hypothetical protein